MRAINISAFLLIFCLMLSLSSFSQDGPPPPPANHGQNGNQRGGSAPVGSGTLILLTLGLIYGVNRTYIKQKEKNHQHDGEK
ncbi:MAG: hypothetical protein U5Q03_11790 [Bacteroidota bacterium]|nr:hypothetical protein [Bacteroidota bacterium]